MQRIGLQFRESVGNITLVLKTMLESPEFWDMSNRKNKAAFVFIVNTLRSSDVEIMDKTELLRWCNEIGQHLFYFQPPTACPTEADFWLNEAVTVHRIKLSHLLAGNTNSGVTLQNAGNNDELVNRFVEPEFQKR